MPTPAQIEDTQRQAEAARLLSALDSLERCEGFTHYLGPKIFAAYDAAQTRILDAHASGKPPASTDIATLQGYHDLVTAWRTDKRSALSSLTSPQKSTARQA